MEEFEVAGILYPVRKETVPITNPKTNATTALMDSTIHTGGLTKDKANSFFLPINSIYFSLYCSCIHSF